MKKLLLTLLFAALAYSAAAQVSGVVYDGATGEPFMGVSVLIKGTMTDTIPADADLEKGFESIPQFPGNTL